MSVNKKAYFQGGGGVNEPTPGKKKYKSDPAIVVQPRFKEPFYRNYDLYTIPGMEDVGPGTGYHGLQNYKSVQEFLAARRERLKPRYVADDSWQVDSGERIKKNPERKARMSLFEKIIKQAGPNYDLGKGLYQEMSDGKVDSVEEFREEGNHGPSALMADDNDDHMLPPKEHGQSIYDWRNSPYQGTPKIPKQLKKNIDKSKADTNDIDFPIDDEVNHDSIVYPIEDEYEIRREKGDKYVFPSDGSTLDPANLNISLTTPQIAGEHSYLPETDFAGRSDEALNFGRDYDNEAEMPEGDDLANLSELEDKYLTPSETDLFGLPDGIDPISDLDPEQTIQTEQPYTGTSDISSEMYEDKWNI